MKFRRPALICGVVCLALGGIVFPVCADDNGFVMSPSGSHANIMGIDPAPVEAQVEEPEEDGASPSNKVASAPRAPREHPKPEIPPGWTAPQDVVLGQGDLGGFYGAGNGLLTDNTPLYYPGTSGYSTPSGYGGYPTSASGAVGNVGLAGEVGIVPPAGHLNLVQKAGVSQGNNLLSALAATQQSEEAPPSAAEISLYNQFLGMMLNYIWGQPSVATIGTSPYVGSAGGNYGVSAAASASPVRTIRPAAAVSGAGQAERCGTTHTPGGAASCR